MGKDITFHLGHPSNLDSRLVQLFDVTEAPRDLITEQTLAGSAETLDIELDDDRRFQLILTDRRGGDDLAPTVFDFSTSDDITPQSGAVSLLSWEDTSSSSSSSPSSSSQSVSDSSASSLSSSSQSASSDSSTQSVSELSSASSLSSSSSSSSQTESSSSSSSSASSSTQP